MLGQRTATRDADLETRLKRLGVLERKVLWLSSWMIHHANHVRPHRDGLKVGGHQASSASLATVMTALYFDVLRPEDRVAVKPHASPAFHAIQYLLGLQTREAMENFRALGGAQSYPSRTKDADDVDFSTGSVGLGVAMTAFASLVQDYVSLKDWLPEGRRPGRMVALMGDAELDEGNVFEALLEGWKHDLRNTWWVIDYNRQSLDAVISDRLFGRVDDIFRTTGWHVVTLKYGKALQEVFTGIDGGHLLQQWIDDCPNSLYSALTYKGGAGWREHLGRDLKEAKALTRLIGDLDDDRLHDLMTNLGGHDMPSLLEAFHGIDDDHPTCFLAYTIKGKGLPFAGHKDNHAGLMSPEQMAAFQQAMGVPKGQEWEPFAGLDLPADELRAFLDQVPFAQAGRRRYQAAKVDVPKAFPMPKAASMSTQEAFGRILFDIAGSDSELAKHIVTTSPDVTVSTNLGGWVNRRGIFDRHAREDVFRAEKVVSAQRWQMGHDGQHIELGIAENNLFLMLAAMGLSTDLFGVRLLPIGTLYDPFINRGLDALNYAAYQGARFMVVATPSGITLAPEGGAHQSVITPLVGLGQPGLTSFEPAFVDELSVIMRWGLEHMQADDGGGVYLRLSTRALAQPEREMTPKLAEDVLTGAYWLREPADDAELAIVFCGAVAPDALAAWEAVVEDIPGAGLLCVTSPDRLYANYAAAWRRRVDGEVGARSHLGRLTDVLAKDGVLVSVLDGHPATLGWMGTAARRRLLSLGVDGFGQSGDIPDLYRVHRIDADAIVDACAAACLARIST